MPKWEEQWNRIERYYKRFCEINNGFTPHLESSDYYFDDMLAFFQNCFHLRDWLKEAGFTSKNFKLSPDDYVKNIECLAICADLANGTKHMVLNSPPKSRSEPKPGPRKFEATMGSSVIQLGRKIEHKGKMLDAFTLATDCMKAWKVYLY